MIISHKLNCIFIHIQKTGGNSVHQAMLEADPDTIWLVEDGRHHLWAREGIAIVGRALWDRYFKFSFVRNPWERLVSWHSMCVQRPGNAFQAYVHDHLFDFNDFVEHGATGLASKTAVPQLDYLSNESGEVIIDYVGRTETFEADLIRLGDRLGIRSAHRANASDHGPYRAYYTDRTREIVARRFAKDIDRFGYRF